MGKPRAPQLRFLGEGEDYRSLLREKRAYHRAAAESLRVSGRIEEADTHLDAIGILTCVIEEAEQCLQKRP